MQTSIVINIIVCVQSTGLHGNHAITEHSNNIVSIDFSKTTTLGLSWYSQTMSCVFSELVCVHTRLL